MTPRDRFLFNRHVSTSASIRMYLSAFLSGATLCAWDQQGDAFPNGNFGMVAGGTLGQVQLYDTTSHLKNDAQPAGGNIVFLDGHVDWRNFRPDWEDSALDADILKHRYGGNRRFWW